MIAITIGLITVILSIMALTNKRVLLFFQFILCMTTSYWALSSKYKSGFHIWEDVEYSISNVEHIIEMGVVFYWLIYMVLSFVVFYFLISILLKIMAFNIMSKIYKRMFNAIPEKEKYLEEFHSLMGQFEKYVFFKIFKSDSTREVTKEELDSAFNQFYSAFCLFVHFAICWNIWGINKAEYITTIFLTFITTMAVFLIFFVPITRFFRLKLPSHIEII